MSSDLKKSSRMAIVLTLPLTHSSICNIVWMRLWFWFIQFFLCVFLAINGLLFIVFEFVFLFSFPFEGSVWWRLIYLHSELNRFLHNNILDFDFLLPQLNWMINNGNCCHSTTIKIIFFLMNSQIKRYLGFLLSVIAFNNHYFNCKFPYKDTLNVIQYVKKCRKQQINK